jgi:hypothetical protein
MAAAEPRGEPCAEGRGSPPEGPGKTQGVAFRRSCGPRSRLRRASRLTNVPLRSTVAPGDGAYPGNLGFKRRARSRVSPTSLRADADAVGARVL